MPTTRRALSENEDMDASQPLKRSSDAAAAALFEDLPSPAADPASADPCPRTLAFARSELEALTVPVLKDRLRSLSLKVGGKKGELVERLLESEQSGATAAEAEPVVVDGVRVIDVDPVLVERIRAGAFWGQPYRPGFGFSHLGTIFFGQQRGC